MGENNNNHDDNDPAVSTDSRPCDHHVNGRAEVLVPAPGSTRGLDGGGVWCRRVTLLAYISALLLVIAGYRNP